MEARVLLAIFLTILPWASAFAAIRAGLQDFSPGHLTLLRFLVASGVLLFYAFAVRMPLPEPRDWPRLLGLGFLGITVYHIALNFGQVSVKAGPAALLVAVGPVFVALFSYFFLGERLSGWGWAGIGLAFTGVALIALGNHPGHLAIEPGALLILLAALTTSLYFVFQRSLVRKYNPLFFTAYTIWAGTLPLLLFWPGLPAALRAASPQAFWSGVYLGVVPGALAYLTWNYALSRAPASKVSSFLYLSPVLATLIAYLWLGEVPGRLALVGGGLALAGVMMVNILGRVSLKGP